MTSFTPKTIGEFDLLATPNANTVLPVEHTYSNGQVSTMNIGLGKVLNGLAGPYADDTAAAAANVSIGTGYYTSAGVVRVRVV